jgi:hypothetical protein
MFLFIGICAVVGYSGLLIWVVSVAVKEYREAKAKDRERNNDK